MAARGEESSRATLGDERFQALAQHTPVGVFVSDADGACVEVNERWCELTGLGREQALGDGWTAALHPDDRERVLREWAEASREGRDSRVEYRFLRPDGSVRWIEGFANAMRDASGRVTGYVGTCLDFTERRAIENALRESSERFRAAFEGTATGMALVAPDGRWLEVNRVLCDILGYSEDELRTMTYQDVTHPDDLEQSVQLAEAALSKADPSYRLEKRYVRSDGETVWVVISSSVIRDADGTPLHFVTQVEDITERRRTQEALREAEELFRRAFDNAPIGMALVVEGGRFYRVNRSLCELTGYTEAELLTRTVQDITHPDDIAANQEQARRLLRGEVQAFTMEKRYIRADGRPIWVSLSATLVRSATGEPLYFVAQVEDVDERRRTREALLEAEERFRNAFDHAPIGMGLVATDGRWLRVNRRLCEITGYGEEELLQRTFLEITHPADRDRGLADRRRILEGELGSLATEKRYIRKDGQVVWVTLSSSIVRDASGTPLYFVTQVEDVTERRRAQEELRYLADHDSLTGLLNRRRLRQELSREVERIRRHGGEAALVLLDLDNFKHVNDTLGHLAGDELLQAVAATLRARLRETDVVARLGGDEFAAILVGAELDEASLVANELVGAVRNEAVVLGGRVVRITASAGLAPIDPDVRSEDDLLVAADVAMYAAKAAGRDGVSLAA